MCYVIRILKIVAVVYRDEKEKEPMTEGGFGHAAILRGAVGGFRAAATTPPISLLPPFFPVCLRTRSRRVACVRACITLCDVVLAIALYNTVPYRVITYHGNGMPSKKKKYNARFPAGRIKKIMQTDEEVGKVAQAVPIIISRTLELFVHSLLTKTMQITSAKNAKTLSPSHMKQCILSESRFDFLKDLVKSLPDVSGPDDEISMSPETPAPLQTNAPSTVTSCSTTTHPDPLEYQKHLGLPVSTETNANNSSTRDNGSSVVSNLNLTNQKAAMTVTGHLQVPEFHTSIPTAFQISRPNFYTELNPSVSDQPTSNFARTANIDEDYDT
ncbi:uncharacterized protein LOC105832947 [Monomorium pharaonis]|uniref:uncharacterized protein LOC105832947 n=1 Tax=Monomorium pharaonis TaxID=307658 RepID=UPI00102E1252|nr:uncharacterized protein LOC105832947 [Monomorium pharaonis]